MPISSQAKAGMLWKVQRLPQEARTVNNVGRLDKCQPKRLTLNSEDIVPSSEETLRLSYKICKQISLIHKDDPKTVRTFHSISEASRELNIPSSRLKSRVRSAPLGTFGRLDGWAVTSLGSD